MSAHEVIAQHCRLPSQESLKQFRNLAWSRGKSPSHSDDLLHLVSRAALGAQMMDSSVLSLRSFAEVRKRTLAVRDMLQAIEPMNELVAIARYSHEIIRNIVSASRRRYP